MKKKASTAPLLWVTKLEPLAFTATQPGGTGPTQPRLVRPTRSDPPSPTQPVRPCSSTSPPLAEDSVSTSTGPWPVWSPLPFLRGGEGEQWESSVHLLTQQLRGSGVPLGPLCASSLCTSSKLKLQQTLRPKLCWIKAIFLKVMCPFTRFTVEETFPGSCEAFSDLPRWGNLMHIPACTDSERRTNPGDPRRLGITPKASG